MKIVVIGGSGLIGSKLVEKLRRAGHEPLAASPETGVDTYTGKGLEQALEGAQAVVDVSNAPAWDDAAVLDFFQTTAHHVLDAEFIGRIVDSSVNGDSVHLPPVLVQPEAADDVAAELADVALNEPVNGIIELAGPEQFRLDELARRVLRAKKDPRRVNADVHARYFGAELDKHSLTPGENPRIAPTRFEDWLLGAEGMHPNLATQRRAS